MVRFLSRKISYEIFKGKKPSLAHFKVFKIKYFIHINDKKDIDKFEAKSELRIFLSYSKTSRAYKIYNLKNDTVEESPHVIFNESVDKSVNYRNEDNEDFIENKKEHEVDEDDTEEPARPQEEVSSQTGNNPIINIRELKSYLLENVIRNLNELTRTRSHFRIIEEMNSLALVSQIEPKNTKIAPTDESWINVMHEEYINLNKIKCDFLCRDP